MTNKSLKRQKRFSKRDYRDRMDHKYTKPFTGLSALFHAVLHRAILDCMFRCPEDLTELGTSYLREVGILEECRVKAYEWLFTEGFTGEHIQGRIDVCDLAGVDPQCFEDRLPTIKKVIDHIQIHGDYGNCRPQEVARWISGMLIRNSQDETLWQEVVEA